MLENNEIIAKSKKSDLTVKVTYKDNNIIRGVVLVGNQFSNVGDVDYWSTSNFDIFDSTKTKVVFSDYPIQEVNIPKHYDNSKGTLYQVATERGWNSYLFDIVKRLERAEKKGEFKTDLEKSKVVIDLWLKESEL